jgi:cytidine deaminase
MSEDHLSPQLGRLIDVAKSAVNEAGLSSRSVEVVGFLTAGGEIFTGCYSKDDPENPSCDAATDALERCIQAGHEDIDAAIVAGGDASEDSAPCAECHAVLMDIDPELPLLVKQRGRWVLLPVDRVSPQT